MSNKFASKKHITPKVNPLKADTVVTEIPSDSYKLVPPQTFKKPSFIERLVTRFFQMAGLVLMDKLETKLWLIGWFFLFVGILYWIVSTALSFF